METEERKRRPRASVSSPAGRGEEAAAERSTEQLTGNSAAAPAATRPKRFHGSVALDSTRVGRAASRIAEEVIAHLAVLVGAKVAVILEVEAEIPDGTPEQVIQMVTKSGRDFEVLELEVRSGACSGRPTREE